MCNGVSLIALPLSVFILVPVTFVTTYAIAVSLGHVEAGFPYISDTGTYSPESCIFSQLLNIVAVLVGLCIYIRCRQVEEYNRHDPGCLLKLNRASLYIGLLSALGISIVANFQETHVFAVHIVGAVLAFGLGTVYAWIQTIVSYKMHPHMNPIAVCHVRLFICLIASISFVTTFVGEALAKKDFHGDNPRKWYPQDGGFVAHVVSTASEWTLCIVLQGYFLSFVWEFRKITMTPPKIQLVVEPLDVSEIPEPLVT